MRDLSRRSGPAGFVQQALLGTVLLETLVQRRHVETGALGVYTSADSVFRLLHTRTVSRNSMSIIRIAREILQGEHGVARVIARRF